MSKFLPVLISSPVELNKIVIFMATAIITIVVLDQFTVTVEFRHEIRLTVISIAFSVF